LATWLLTLAAGWAAATVSGVAGFGGALLLLPALTAAFGARSAVPVLTVAQTLGNLSRAGFGWGEIKWRPAVLFSFGAVPACVVGAWLFAGLPAALIRRLVGGFLLAVVAFGHLPVRRQPLREAQLPAAGACVGLVSSTAGSAGPLGASVFLGLGLPAGAYVATEAVTAVLMHATKSVVYGRYGVMTADELRAGLALGGAMAVGSWTGRRLLRGLSPAGFRRLAEVLLVVSALALLLAA
jgi:uncharacterized membrane protein YfcA